LGLFAEAEIDLLLSPRDGTAVPARARPATSVAILDYLEALYRASKRLDRFLFYFAGHGISARRDPAHTKLCAALIPADVRAIGSDGRRLIDFDDLRARFRMRGPLEQFYIVDACRDLGWERNPDVSGAGWSAEPDDAPRRQATLFAVSPLGQARGRAGQLGLMSSHLLDALDGKGSAMDLIVVDNQQRYGVTIQSVRDYVYRRVAQELSGVPAWTLHFNLPALEDPDPKPGYLRLVDTPPRQQLTVNVDPPNAASAIEASLQLYEHRIAKWPPFGVAVSASPTRYQLSARLVRDSDRWMSPEPETCVIDVREESTITLKVPMRGVVAAEEPSGTPPAPLIETKPVNTATGIEPVFDMYLKGLTDSFPATGIEMRSTRTDHVEATQAMLNVAGEIVLSIDGVFGPITKNAIEQFQSQRGLRSDGRVTAATWRALRSALREADFGVIEPHAIDPGIQVVVEALGGTRQVFKLAPGKRRPLPNGAYRVSFRLGDEIINRTELLLAAGERRVVHATAESGPALAELIVNADPVRKGKRKHLPSETIGPMQAACLSTLLPLVGLKPFDRNDKILSRLNLGVPRLPSNTKPDGFIAVTIGFEGVWSAKTQAAAIERTVVTCARSGDASAPQAETNRLTDNTKLHLVRSRTGVFLFRPGLGAWNLRVAVPGVAALDLATSTIAGRVTCVGAVVSADGRLKLVQSLLLPPNAPPEDPDLGPFPPQRVARLLALAERIYTSGDDVMRVLHNKELSALEYGKWIDPILGVLAWLARTNTLSGPTSSSALDGPIANTVADNLNKYFGAVPDVQIIQALRRNVLWKKVLAEARQPLLAASLRAAATAALQEGASGHPFVERWQRLAPREIWNMTISPLSARK